MDISYLRRRDAVPLFAWHDVANYGDRLGPALFHLVTRKPVYIEARGLNLIFEQGAPRQIHCFLGTLGHLISGPHHFVFWGFGTAPPSGPLHHGCRAITPNLDIEFRALRGPLTRQAFVDAGYEIPDSIPFGDPALLVPGFFESSPQRIDDFCVIPHHTDYEEWRERLRGMNVIDLRLSSYDNLQAMIVEITRYGAVFSASLHATILAESFGIPTRPIVPTLPFKFDDFYASIGKTVGYIHSAQRDLDWAALYEQTLREWKPAIWNPDAWLDTSPFPIDETLRRRLRNHYAQLGKRALPLASSAKLPEAVRDTYRLINFTSPGIPGQPATGGPDLETKTLETQTFHETPANWHLQANGETTQFTGEDPAATIRDGECELVGVADRCLVTHFFEVGDALDITVVFDFSDIQGLAEIWLQNGNFETIEQIMVQPDDHGGTRELHHWPVVSLGKVRAVIFPLRGRLVLRSLQVAGLFAAPTTDLVASGLDQDAESAPS